MGFSASTNVRISYLFSYCVTLGSSEIALTFYRFLGSDLLRNACGQHSLRRIHRFFGNYDKKSSQMMKYFVFSHILHIIHKAPALYTCCRATLSFCISNNHILGLSNLSRLFTFLLSLSLSPLFWAIFPQWHPRLPRV